MENDKISLYDCITNTHILIPKKGMVKKCRELGFDYTNLYKLLDNKRDTINSRFILSNKMNLVFKLVDFDSKQEYNCVNNKTIFLHLNKEYNDNEAKYVYELRSGRQRFASICDKVFYLKGGKMTLDRIKITKNESKRLDDIVDRRINKNKLREKLQNKLINTVKTKKCNRLTEKLIGCSYTEFIEYLESKFVEGMCWENYGEWHLDHIIPVSHFNLFSIRDRYKCFNYKNIQPLWATKAIAAKYTKLPFLIGNIEKSNKLFNIDYSLIHSLREHFKLKGIDIPDEKLLLICGTVTSYGYRKHIKREADIIDNNE